MRRGAFILEPVRASHIVMDTSFTSGMVTGCQKKVIEHPEKISVEEILSQWNVEVRRIMIERFGFEKFIKDTKSEKIHEDECGALVSQGVRRR